MKKLLFVCAALVVVVAVVAPAAQGQVACLKWQVFCDGVQVDTISGSNITATWYHYDCANNQPGLKGKIAPGRVLNGCNVPPNSPPNGNALIACRVADGCNGLGGDYYWVLDSLDGTLDFLAGLYPDGVCFIDELTYTKLSGGCVGGPEAGPQVSSAR